LRNQAKANIKRYIDERLPEGYEKCLVGLTAITKEAWNTAEQSTKRYRPCHYFGVLFDEARFYLLMQQ
jgi:hypothetical protein